MRAVLRLAISAVLVMTFVTTGVSLRPVDTVEARVQGRPVFVRDAEAEDLLRDYARPFFGAARIGTREPEVYLIQDRQFNAFVADGRRIFMNTGVLIDAEDPTEVLGVLAHEVGHIAGGHLAGLHDALARARTIAGIATVLGAAGAVAGGLVGGGEAAQGGLLIAGGGKTAGLRSLLSYRRSQEIAADRAALTYLDAAGISARGMVETFKRFQNDQIFSSRFVDPYSLSHPIARERLAATERLARMSRHWDAPVDPALLRRHELVRAKLLAFTTHPKSVRRAYPRSDRSVAARYARAIATSRVGSPDQAAKQMDDLLREQPNNPYFWEFKGQIMLEAGRPREAVKPLSRAVSLKPRSGLIRILYGRALLATNDKRYLSEAVKQLERGLGTEPNDSLGWRQLAIAQSRLGNDALANLATANVLLITGDVAGAKSYAKRSQAGLRTGSPSWLRAEDIVQYRLPDFMKNHR